MAELTPATTGGNRPLAELSAGDAAVIALAHDVAVMAETDPNMPDLRTYYAEPAVRLRDARPDELPLFGGGNTIVEHQNFTRGDDVVNEVNAATEAVASGEVGMVRIYAGWGSADGRQNMSSQTHNTAAAVNQVLASPIGRMAPDISQATTILGLTSKADEVRSKVDIVDELFPVYTDSPDQVAAKKERFINQLSGVDRVAVMSSVGAGNPEERGRTKGVYFRLNDPNTGQPTNTFLEVKSIGFTAQDEQQRTNAYFVSLVVLPPQASGLEQSRNKLEGTTMPALSPSESGYTVLDQERNTDTTSPQPTSPAATEVETYSGSYAGHRITSDTAVLDAQASGATVMGPGGPEQSFRIDVPPISSTEPLQ